MPESPIEEKKFAELASPQLSYASSVVDRRRVLRKLDRHLLPFVSVLYLLSFLDRTNIGNAKVAGLTTDLHLTGLQYNLCSAIFFLPYTFFEVPSNMAMKLLRPSRWIPCIMVCWGIVMLSMAFVKSFSGLIAARIFLGFTESGLFPGVTFYLCMWYPRAAQAQRVSIFLSAATVAGAFGGILAFGIERMKGIGGLAGWSWIFLLEGLLTVVVSGLSFFFMHDDPETATFLTPEEREWLINTIKEDTAGLAKTFQWKFIAQALRDRHTYLYMLLYLFTAMPAYSFALFLPTIITGLGYSAAHAQLLTIPPYVAGCILTVAYGVLSDRWGMRGPFVLVSAVTGLVGYVILFATSKAVVGYIGTIIASCGLFPAAACVLAWTGGNVGGDIKRGVVIAMTIGLGNLGGFASSFIYRAQDSPRYHPGHATNISCLAVAAVLSAIGMLELHRLNRQKQLLRDKEGITSERMAEFREMGDSSPLYK
ncbi:MFS general substrate transporter [Fomitopsis serialis]|uniref:MFS general substrate transporter n=1 Tax=Fomitopsis serialis TaxID=139415 RepID=UPI002008BDE7|nr:MFS general substrate transporter [Neoantrodia serialis]KAH9934371.1 MFS general substrate transporter [Neoantrodia serialis]